MDTLKQDAPPSGASSSISDSLREARLAKGLELREISERTHVRVDYLEALEEGRFDKLPESIYARNFLKLFASAVGLDASAMAERFAHEVSGMTPPPSSLNAELDDRVRRFPEQRVALGNWLPAILLVLAVLGLTLWLFNRFLFNPPTLNDTPATGVTGEVIADDSSVLPPANTADDTSTASAADTLPEDASDAVAATLVTPPSEVLVTLTTTPPGAQVSIDSYALPGTTPIENAPISSGEGRTVTLTLDGYAPLTETVDLNEDSTLAFTLRTEADLAAESSNTDQAGTDSSAVLGAETSDTASENVVPEDAEANAASTDEGLTLTVNEATWVEVYQSEARGAGERLVYETVQPGSTFTFDLPIYIHVGNANGVTINLAGQDLGSLGSTGEVTGRAFTQ